MSLEEIYKYNFEKETNNLVAHVSVKGSSIIFYDTINPSNSQDIRR